MALIRETARLAKLLVDSQGITFEEAQKRLMALKLEIVVGPDAHSRAAHAAALTAVSVGLRSFVGGVRVTGCVHIPANTLLPIEGDTLAQKCARLGASDYDGEPTCRICIGSFDAADGLPTFFTWWDSWCAGVREARDVACDDGRNPLVGIAAGALAVGAAFGLARGKRKFLPADLNLWGGNHAPPFAQVFLPNSLWMIGLGNLGQAYLWALASLPYEDPCQVSLLLQDDDRVSPEN